MCAHTCTLLLHRGQIAWNTVFYFALFLTHFLAFFSRPFSKIMTNIIFVDNFTHPQFCRKSPLCTGDVELNICFNGSTLLRHYFCHRLPFVRMPVCCAFTTFFCSILYNICFNLLLNRLMMTKVWARKRTRKKCSVDVDLLVTKLWLWPHQHWATDDRAKSRHSYKKLIHYN